MIEPTTTAFHEAVLAREALCDRYEADCRAARAAAVPVPRLQEYLPPSASPACQEGFRELLELELWYRSQEGESPRVEEYLARFPDGEPVVREVFARRAWTETGAARGPAASNHPAPPGYEILGELGSGGFGVVYRARHQALDRVVAIKMLKDGDDRARFRAEAEAVARLHHPNVVQIFEIGEHQGRPFLVLEYCAGGNLANLLERHAAGLPFDDVLRLMEALARAVAHSHERDIVHRDLKPANVLFQQETTTDPEGAHAGEVVSATRTGAPGARPDFPTPKVTDFGLAKRLDRPGQTSSGMVIGTLSYMAPEQAQASKQVGPAADVWALGAILYQCLTGRPPFPGERVDQLFYQIIRAEPVRPRLLRPAIRRDLETICLRCLEKSPGRRYASASALADDLARYRAGQPILARPVRAWERAMKWARRNPAVASLSAAVVLSVGVGLGVAGHFWRDAVRSRDAARAEYAALITTLSDLVELHQRDAQFPEGDATNLLRAVVERIEGSYGELLTRHDDSPELRLQRARVWMQVAWTRHHLGDARRAVGAADWALALLPADRRRERCRWLADLSMIRDMAGEGEESERMSEEAERLSRELLEAAPDDPDALDLILECRRHYWTLGRQQRDPSGALASLEEAVTLHGRLPPERAALPAAEGRLSVLWLKIGSARALARQTGRIEEALLQARVIQRRLVAAHPRSAEWRAQLAETANQLGQLYCHFGRHEDALREHREALQERQALTRDFPSLWGNYLMTAVAYTRLIEVREAQRRPGFTEEIRTHRRKAAEAMDEVVRRQRSPKFCNDATNLWEAVARDEEALGRPAEAARARANARAHREQEKQRSNGAAP